MEFTLNSGFKIPIIGFGTWSLDNTMAEKAVFQAIQIGYRLIDTARYYNNEKGTGLGIRKAIEAELVKREELFITSKLMPTNSSSTVNYNIDDSLSNLGLEYIDLMLVHQSGYGDKKTYQTLEQAVKSGKIRSIGISNYYYSSEFERMIKDEEIIPAIVQNENHIYYQNNKFQDYLKAYGTIVESWYPFGGRGHLKENLNNTLIQKIALNHEKTPAQIILRWHIQAGYIPIPGSNNPVHIQENFNVFDFELTNDEMNQIFQLNRNQRYEHF